MSLLNALSLASSNPDESNVFPTPESFVSGVLSVFGIMNVIFNLGGSFVNALVVLLTLTVILFLMSALIRLVNCVTSKFFKSKLSGFNPS